MRRFDQVLAFTAMLVLPSLTFPLTAQEQDKTVYTYVAEWRVPRAKSAAFQTFFQKNDQPILDRLLADNTIKEYGRTSTMIHSESGMTDGLWFSAYSFSGIEKVLSEFAKLDMTGFADLIEKHSDSYLASVIFRTGNSKATGGFLEDSLYVVKPGKGEEWLKLWKKWMQPVYEKLVADGTLVGYGIDREAYHTTVGGSRWVWTMADSPQAVDKVDAAFDAARAKYSADELKSINDQMQEVLEPGTHRDSLQRVLYYGHK